MQDKVDIKHFLNTKIKAVPYAGSDFYPLYLAIQTGGKKVQIKSGLSGYLKIYNGPLERLTNGDKQLALLMHSGLFSEPWLRKINRDKKFPVYPLMADEISALKKVIEYRMAGKGKIDLSGIGLLYENCIREITDVIDDHIKSAFQDELKALFLKSIDSAEKKEMFRLVNYFIHFINWNRPFYDVYDATSELMPGELKKIEGRLSKELRLSIKTYTAFYTFINPLKRFFEKREQGRIATLSFLDWQSDIKELLIRQFTSLLGRKTAVLYVTRLDEILNHCLGCKG